MPCVAVVENMSHFDADGKRYYPFGRGSGSQVITLSNLQNVKFENLRLTALSVFLCTNKYIIYIKKL